MCYLSALDDLRKHMVPRWPINRSLASRLDVWDISTWRIGSAEAQSEPHGGRMTYHKFLVFVTSCFVSLALCSGPAFAQGSTAAISGLVTDSSGSVVAGAQVQAVNVNTNVAYPTKTDQAGLYSLPSLPPGEYRMEVDATGFQREVQSGITLHVAESTTLNITLQVGSVSQTVEVQGAAPIIDTSTTSLGGLVNDQQMADLPLNGRNVDSLMLLQPGTSVTIEYNTPGPHGVTGNLFSSNGAPVQSNNLLLDGAPLVNAEGLNATSLLGTFLGVDGIKEFQMVSSVYDATYGLTMGSQMVMLSKGGTNQWHGDAFEYLRNNSLDGKNYFDTTADSGYHPDGDPRRLPPFRRNQFGGSFGGPIKKDKVFFYGVYESLRQLLSQTGNTVVPPAACHDLVAVGSNYAFPNNTTASSCAAGLTSATVVPGVIGPLINLVPEANNGTDYTTAVPNQGADNYGQFRLDYNLSEKDSFFGRYTIDWTDIDNASSLHLYTNPGFNHNQFLTLGENHTFSSSLLNSARFSYGRTVINETNQYPTSLTGPQYSMVPGLPMGLVAVGGSASWGSGVGYPENEVQGVFTLSDDVFYTHGRHNLKFGASLDRYDLSIFFSQFTLGYVVFANLASFMQGLPVSAIADLGDTRRDYRYYVPGFYAQDDVHLTPRLTLNLGLRYEFMTTPTEQHGIQSRFLDFSDPSQTYSYGPPLQNPGHLAFSPRVGFAWDVFGNGKTAIRGGAGIYYDVGEIDGVLNTTEISQPPFSEYYSPAVAGRTFQLPFNFVGGGIDVQTANYYDRLPRSYQFNLTVERQLPFGVGLSVSYLGNQGRRLWDAIEGNPYVPSTDVNGVMTWDPYTCNGALSPTPCTGGAVQAPNPTYQRVNPNYGSAVLDSTVGYSYYNGLQVVATKHLSQGLDFQGSFNWSHSIDTGAREFFNIEGCGADGIPINPYDEATDRGSSCLDKRLNFHLSLLYHLPGFRSNGLLSKVGNGWWVGNIVTAQSGSPFTANLSNVDRAEEGVFSDNNPGISRADKGTTTQTVTLPVAGGTYTYTFIPYNKNKVITGNPKNWINPLMFQLGPAGQIGNVGRSLLTGPGLAEWDFSLNKDTKARWLGEAGMIQFRAEFFNILNHANFDAPASSEVFTGTITDPAGDSEAPAGASLANPLGTVGKITATSTTSRQIQFALKLIF